MSNKEEFREWRDHRITQTVIQSLEEVKKEYIESCVQNAGAGESIEAARQAGVVEGLSYFLQVEYSDDLEDDDA